MRIITGKAKGTKLYTLSGEAVRPTTEMAKEGLFSAIQFELEGTEVLDLFAGSGQLGLEALSRGAKEATFVDCSEDSINIIRKNCEKTGLYQNSNIVRSEYGEFIKNAFKRKKQYDFIFADPPYQKDLALELIKRVFKSDLLRSGGALFCETDNPDVDISILSEDIKEQIGVFKQYKYSKCYIYMIRKK